MSGKIGRIFHRPNPIIDKFELPCVLNVMGCGLVDIEACTGFSGVGRVLYID